MATNSSTGGYAPGSYNAELYQAVQARKNASVPGTTATGIVPYTPGSTVSNYGSNTTNMSGPNGPFSSLNTPLITNANALLSSGNTILNTAFDPQKTLYNQQYQQLQDQTNVNEAQRGITMSPYGAGVANQADINFNTNWQNQQLQRQATGISAAANAMAPATGLYNSSYGTATTGYNTQPPQPQDNIQPVLPNLSNLYSAPSAQLGGSVPQSASINIAPTAPYQSPITPQGLSGQTDFAQATGANTDTSSVINQPGVDYQAVSNPSPQQQLTPDQYTTAVTGGGYQPYVDPNTVASPQYGGVSTNQLINQASQPNVSSPVIQTSDYQSIMNTMPSDSSTQTYNLGYDSIDSFMG